MTKNAFAKVIAALMALIMTLGVFTAFPSARFSSVMAEGTDEFPELSYVTENGSRIVLGKDAYLAEDGTYTIELSAYNAGTPIIKQRTAKVPMDYVLVIDASNSMKDNYSCQLSHKQVVNGEEITFSHHWSCYHISATRAAASAFIDELRADSTTFENPEWNLDSRVAVVTYATGDAHSGSNGANYYYNGTGIYKATGSDEASFYKYKRNTADAADIPLASSIYDDAFMSVLDDYEAAQNAIDAIKLNPYTAMHLGMEMAEGIIKATAARTTASQDDHYNKYYDQDAGEWKVRPKVVVLFTDGVSGNIGYSNKSVGESIEHANQIKATGAKIYTVGLVSTTMFTQHGECWQNEFGKGEVTGAYGGPHKGIGEFQVNNYAFEEFTNSEPTPLKNRQKEYFAGFEKLKTDLGLTSDEAALEKYIELQKNQYRIMGLTRGFLYKDVLMAISSEYDYVNVSYVNERDAVNNNGKTCDWVLYDHDGKFIQWYSSAPVVDLKDKNGDRIGARYGQTMTNVLKGDKSLGETYPSTNAIWKKMYQTTTENLLTLDPVDGKYKYMDVEVPVVTQQAGYVGGERVGYEYAPNADLKYYIPITNAFDLVGGSGQDNIQILIDAFKQIEELSITEQIGSEMNSGMMRFSALSDRISENFIVPEELSIEKNFEFWLVPVDNAAMQNDPLNNGSSVNKWLFSDSSKQNRTAGAVIIESAFTNNDIERQVYAQSTFKGGVKYDAQSRTFTFVGFRWAMNNWYCKYDAGSDTYSGWKMVIRIKGLTAKDDIVPNTDIFTNDKNFSGMKQNWKDTRPSTLQTTEGEQTLLFPEPTVRIRDKYVIYDYGFRLEDQDVNGFFGDEGESSDVAHLLSIDYMYRDQKQNGSLNYKNKYPYVGADGRDANGAPIRYADRAAVDAELFEVGFTIEGADFTPTGHPSGAHSCTAYFEPHSIARRDYQLAALLELTGTRRNALGDEVKRYEWSKLVFIPATNVLYEAEQGMGEPTVLSNKKEKLTGDFGIFYSGREKSSGEWQATAKWTVDGSFDESAVQQHYNKLYGNDPVYSGDLAQTGNGAAMSVTVDHALYNLVADKKAQWPVAKFTFEGSGFSFTTTCGINSGIFAVDVVPHGESSSYVGAEGTYLHQFVNTRYYGGVDPNADAPGESPLTIDADTLYQVPVMRNAHMIYGTYDVYVTPVYYPAWAEIPGSGTKGAELGEGDIVSGFPGLDAAEYVVVNAVENCGAELEPVKGVDVSAFTATIDTFRVYHPRGAMVHNKNIDAHEYYAAHEMNAKYVEVRNVILNGIEDILNHTGNDFGAIFMDYGPTNDDGSHINEAGYDPTDPSTFTAKAYALLGPNNEMYLPNTGSFTFKLANPTKVTNLHISAKCLAGAASTMTVTYQYTTGAPVEFSFPVNSATEMYYDIGRAKGSGELLVNANLAGITIACSGGALSLMNLKLVYEDGYTEPETSAAVNTNVISGIDTLEAANVIAFGVKGDMNFDCAVDMTDALLSMRAVLNGEELGISGSYVADVNRDSSIDLADSVSIIRAALGE